MQYDRYEPKHCPVKTYQTILEGGGQNLLDAAKQSQMYFSDFEQGKAISKSIYCSKEIVDEWRTGGFYRNIVLCRRFSKTWNKYDTR